MKRTAFLFFFILISLSLMSQDQAKKEKKDKSKKEKKEKVEKVDLAEREQVRPVNPWLFEAGLEEKAGRVVLALNKNLWMAYDTTTCSAMRVWRGTAFVNTGSERKDMIVEGFNFIENPGTQEVWKVKKGNKVLGAKLSFLKHEIVEEKAYLYYKFTLEDGSSFQLKEHPEYDLQKRPDPNRTTLVRTFSLVNAPKDISLSLDFEVSDLVKMTDLKSSGKIAGLKKSKRMYDWGDLFSAKGSLIIPSGKEASISMTFTMDGESYYRSKPTSTN
ncbi:MAG: hypothetical protein AAF696_13815 [Bacteroidota bacterium]